MRKIFFIGGGKGGVGKSTVSIALIDYLLNQAQRKIILIETDTSNPDVAKIYKDKIPLQAINLDDNDGWINLLNVADENKELDIVINSAARNNIGVTKYGRMLNDALEQLNCTLDTLWVINRQRDSLDLLLEYLKTIENGRLIVLRNLYFGTSDKFELFNNSKSKKSIEDKGGMVFDFPDLADRITDLLNTKRVALADLAAHESLGNRMEIERFRAGCRVIFDEVMER